MGMQTPTRHPADPGTPRSRKLALLAAVVFAGLLIVLQNSMAVNRLISEQAPVAGAEESNSAVPPPSPAEPFTLSARFAVQTQDMPGWFTGKPDEVMPVLDGWATSDADRVRAAIVAGELVGADEAVRRLETLKEDLSDDSPLRGDIDTLLTIYRDGGQPDEAAAETLKKHHGFFGEVALTHGLPDTDPRRAGLIGGGARLVAVLLGVGALVIAAMTVGLVLFIAALVMLLTGRIRARMPRPEPGGSVFLETYALFAAAFVVLSVGLDLVGEALPEADWLLHVQIVLQWLLLLVPLWPLRRGMSLKQLAGAIGWHRGEGVLKEMGCGVLGYLAGLPLLAAGMGLSMGLMVIVQLIRAAAGMGPPPPPDSAVFDLAASQSPLIMVLFFLLATVWAPLCEESIFRGALYRHLRGRFGVVVSALVVALLFGLSHNYGPVLVFPVVALGFTFCMLREWRGSLIASMTAHSMHNATITLVLFFVLKMIS